jgi:hypothetical protein
MSIAKSINPDGSSSFVIAFDGSTAFNETSWVVDLMNSAIATAGGIEAWRKLPKETALAMYESAKAEEESQLMRRVA